LSELNGVRPHVNVGFSATKFARALAGLAKLPDKVPLLVLRKAPAIWRIMMREETVALVRSSPDTVMTRMPSLIIATFVVPPSAVSARNDCVCPCPPVSCPRRLPTYDVERVRADINANYGD
jgi:hypothetical protein